MGIKFSNNMYRFLWYNNEQIKAEYILLILKYDTIIIYTLYKSFNCIKNQINILIYLNTVYYKMHQLLMCITNF